MANHNKKNDIEFLFKDQIVNIYTGMKLLMDIKKTKADVVLNKIERDIKNDQKRILQKIDEFYEKIDNNECIPTPLVNKITLEMIRFYTNMNLLNDRNFKEFSETINFIAESINADLLSSQNHKSYQQQQKHQNYLSSVLGMG